MRLLLLDVDGTLVDSNYHHVISWQRALHECGATISAATVHRYVGMGSERFVRDALGNAFADEHGERARVLHRQYFHDFDEMRRGLPGAQEIITHAKEYGITVVLASSSERGEINANLGRVGISQDDVRGIVCGDDVVSSKPSPDVFIAGMELAGYSPGTDSVVVVGDSVWDAQAARACDVRFIGVETGGTEAATLSGAGAVAVYATLTELVPSLDQLL